MPVLRLIIQPALIAAGVPAEPVSMGWPSSRTIRPYRPPPLRRSPRHRIGYRNIWLAPPLACDPIPWDRRCDRAGSEDWAECVFCELVCSLSSPFQASAQRAMLSGRQFVCRYYKYTITVPRLREDYSKDATR